MYVNPGLIFGISWYGRHIHFQDFGDVEITAGNYWYIKFTKKRQIKLDLRDLIFCISIRKGSFSSTAKTAQGKSTSSLPSLKTDTNWIRTIIESLFYTGIIKKMAQILHNRFWTGSMLTDADPYTIERKHLDDVLQWIVYSALNRLNRPLYWGTTEIRAARLRNIEASC